MKSDNLSFSIPEVLVVDNINGNVRTLGYYYYFKHLYVSGQIHGYSISSMARKAGVSRTVIRKHVNDMVSYGWCYIDGDSLVFRSTLKICPDAAGPLGGRVIKVTCINNIGSIIKALRCAMLQVLRKRQEMVINLKHSNKKRHRLLLRKLGYRRDADDMRMVHKEWFVRFDHFSISHKRLSWYMGLSVTAIKDMLRELRNMGILRVQHNRRYLGPYSRQALRYFSEVEGVRLLVHKGSIYRQLINSYILDQEQVVVV